MIVERHEDVRSFREQALPLLVEREAENGLMIGLLERLAENPHAFSESDPVALEVRSKDGSAFGFALMTPPHNVLFSRMPEDGVAPVVDHLLDASCDVPGVLGPTDLARLAAEHYAKRTGATPRLRMKERIYEARRVKVPPKPTGALRRAEARDLSLLLGWAHDFAVDARIAERQADLADQTRKLNEAGNLYVWETRDQLVSMAAVTRKTPHGAGVSLVFTPRELRRKGFASALVATLTNQLLHQDSDFCFLFTDLANPTSNSIYQRVGYQPVCDVDMWRWD